jgi:hypothetical protein
MNDLRDRVRRAVVEDRLVELCGYYPEDEPMTCCCTTGVWGNRGCPLHDPALAGTDPTDRDYEDARLRLGGAPREAITTPPELLRSAPTPKKGTR